MAIWKHSDQTPHFVTEGNKSRHTETQETDLHSSHCQLVSLI